MNPSPVATPTVPQPSQRRATPPAGTSLNVWIRLPNLNHELPDAAVVDESPAEAAEAAPPEPDRQTITPVEEPVAEAPTALERRKLHTPLLEPESRSISPVALLTGIVAATALFCLLLVGGRKSPTTDDKSAEKPAAVDSASAVAAPQTDAAKTAEPSPAAQADVKKKKKKKPNAPPSEPGAGTEEAVIGVSPWPRKEKTAAVDTGVVETTSAVTPAGGVLPQGDGNAAYPTTTPWPPQREAQLPPEYRNNGPVAEFEGTIQKPEYRAEHDRIRSSLH